MPGPDHSASRSSGEGYSRLSQRVAEAIKNELLANPRAALGLATGRSPTGAYQLLSRWSREGIVDWSEAKCFGLDEYCDVGERDSFGWYLDQNLYRHTNLPHGSRFDPAHDHNYDETIESSGGLDLTLLGIGSNGHIAFNEPGTPFLSWTHCVYLAESTRKANAGLFASGQVPHRAVTMGLQTILSSRKIILMVTGEQKRGILERALCGPVTEEIPASVLQLHKSLLVETDFDR